MQIKKNLPFRAGIGLSLAIPVCALATMREIPVPNGNLEIMYINDPETSTFTLPYQLTANGLTKVGEDGLGKDDWGGGQEVLTPGWIGTATAYDFSPMSQGVAAFANYDAAINGHVVVAVNPPGWAASAVAETVQEGMYTLAWGAGWTESSAAAYTEIPNVIVTLQYSTDGGTTWMELEGASATVWSNEAELDAVVQRGEFTNDYLLAYEITSESAALGGDLRVHVTTDSPNDAAVADNFRLYHSSTGEIAMELDVPNSDYEVMFTADGETNLFTVPYLMTGAGLTGIFSTGIGKDGWGGGQEVFTPGWVATDTSYDFSPMSRNVGAFSNYDPNINGWVNVAVNPPGWGYAMVEDTITEGNYYVFWGAGWTSSSSAAYTSIPNVIVNLEYSTDGGTTWMNLEEASDFASNKAELAATVERGDFKNGFRNSYTVASDSAAVGGMLRVWVSSDTPTDAAVYDRVRVAKALSADGPLMGPGIFSDYELIDGNVDTDTWMGWVETSFYPYFWIYSINSWAFASDGSGSSSGAWIYLFK